MTELLERAIARLQTLPESEQNEIASLILTRSRTSDAGMKHFRVRQIFLQNSQLPQWLSTVQVKLKNLTQRHCEITHYYRVPSCTNQELCLIDLA